MNPARIRCKSCFHGLYLEILRKDEFFVLQLSVEMSEVVIHLVFLLILK